MNKETIIYYLPEEYIGNLDFETPTGLSSNPNDQKIDGEANRRKAIIEHPNAQKYSLENFEWAFNEVTISDSGYIAIVEQEASNEVLDKIIVEVKGDVVYRDYDNRYFEYEIVDDSKDLWKLKLLVSDGEPSKYHPISIWNAANNGGFLLAYHKEPEPQLVQLELNLF